MNSLKRVSFAVGLMASIHLLVDPSYYGVSEDFRFLTGLPAVLFGLAIASRFWPYDEDTK